jgi:hypothetical protein
MNMQFHNLLSRESAYYLIYVIATLLGLKNRSIVYQQIIFNVLMHF